MGSCLGIVILVGASLGQPPPDADYYAATSVSARELARQMEYLQRAFATIPGPPMGRGLYQQSDAIMLDLMYFRQQIERKVAREDLYLAFDKMDGKLHTMLSDIEALEKWNPALKMTAQRVISADHDLHFAMSSGDGTPVRQSQVDYRQTLVLLSRTENLQGLVNYLFDEMDSLPAWKADFAQLRGQISELQKVQKSKASRDDVKKQLEQTDQAWEKLVTRFKGLREDQSLILRLDFGQVDQVFARLAASYGIKNRRPPLKANFI